MGIRISKDIGYYLPLENFEGFIADNYEEIFEDFDYGSAVNEEFVARLLSTADQYCNEDHFDKSRTNKSLIKYHIRENQNWKPIDLIKKVYDYDDFMGILFLTPELAEQHRYDNLIDYYEAEEHYEFKAQTIGRPIYPCTGYIYTGGWEEHEKFKDISATMAALRDDESFVLEKGCFLENDTTHFIERYLKDEADNPTLNNCFRPNVEPFAWIIAKASGILHEDVTEYQFRTTVVSTIITSWG